jgi:hypothetical protein
MDRTIRALSRQRKMGVLVSGRQHTVEHLISANDGHGRLGPRQVGIATEHLFVEADDAKG